MAILWRNPRDPVRVPDVCIDLALDELEFIELANDFALVFHQDMTGFPKSFGVAKAQCGAAVAGDQFFRRASHSPSLSSVSKLLHDPQAEPVIDETDMRLPSPLVEVRAPVDDPLAEIFRRQIVTLQYLSCFRRDGHHSGVPIDAGALVKYSIQVEKPFGVTLGRVRVRCHYLVAVDRCGVRIAAAEQ